MRTMRASMPFSTRLGYGGNPRWVGTRATSKDRHPVALPRQFASMSVEPNASTGRPLVVLVHGFLGHRLQFLPLAGVISGRGYDVMNFAYWSRTYDLATNSASLVDAVMHRVKRRKPDGVDSLSEKGESPTQVHFVTHSYGGVVLRAALRTGGMQDILDEQTRTVLVAPPARGCVLARTFHNADFSVLQNEFAVLKPYVRLATSAVLGDASGRQFMQQSREWFDEQQDHGEFIGDALVVAGNVGSRLNPLVGKDNDGVIALDETMLPVRHYRIEEALTHNVVLYTPSVMTKIADFLDGKSVGVLDKGDCTAKGA